MIPYDYAVRFKAEGSTLDALIKVVTDMVNEIIDLVIAKKIPDDRALFMEFDKMDSSYESFIRHSGGKLNDGSSILRTGFRIAVKRLRPSAFEAWNSHHGGRLLAD